MVVRSRPELASSIESSLSAFRSLASLLVLLACGVIAPLDGGCIVADTTGLAGPPGSSVRVDGSFDGATSTDADTPSDGASPDGSAFDSGFDASAADAAATDASLSDGGSDSGATDAGGFDAGASDAGLDAGAMDAGLDAGCGICTTGLTCCGSCVNLGTDPNNCGVCGRVCAAGSACSAGKCCPTGQTNCNNLCVNLLVSTSNCGTCGYVCPAHPPMPAACVNGGCR